MNNTLTTTNTFNPTLQYLLIYGDNHYYIHIMSFKTTDEIVALKFSINNIIPKYITPFTSNEHFGYWQIIDTNNHLHFLVIENSGKIVIRKSIYVLPTGNTLLSTYCITGVQEFIMYYTDKENTLKSQKYLCYPLAYHHKYNILLLSSSITEVLPSVISIKYIAHWLYLTTSNSLFSLIDNKLTNIDKYPTHIKGISILYNQNDYVYDAQSNTLYKNNKVIHKFTDTHHALGTCHIVNGKRLAIMFASTNHIRYFVDDDKTTTLREFYIGNIQLVNQVSVQSLFNLQNSPIIIL